MSLGNLDRESYNLSVWISLLVDCYNGCSVCVRIVERKRCGTSLSVLVSGVSDVNLTLLDSGGSPSCLVRESYNIALNCILYGVVKSNQTSLVRYIVVNSRDVYNRLWYERHLNALNRSCELIAVSGLNSTCDDDVSCTIVLRDRLILEYALVEGYKPRCRDLVLQPRCRRLIAYQLALRSLLPIVGANALCRDDSSRSRSCSAVRELDCERRSYRRLLYGYDYRLDIAISCCERSLAWLATRLRRICIEYKRNSTLNQSEVMQPLCRSLAESNLNACYSVLESVSESELTTLCREYLALCKSQNRSLDLLVTTDYRCTSNTCEYNTRKCNEVGINFLHSCKS